jgi:hypothetical protein
VSWQPCVLPAGITGATLVCEYCPICNRSHWKPQTVDLNGVQVCTHSEAWRHECEVRWALRLPDKARKPRISKLDYLNGIEKERGTEARTKLRNEMVRRYKK